MRKRGKKVLSMLLMCFMTFQGLTFNVKAIGTATINSISINPENVTLKATPEKLEEKQLQVIANMSDGTKQILTEGVTFKSLINNVVSVDNTGLIKVTTEAQNGSTVPIIASYQGMNSRCYVKVESTIPYVTNIRVSPNNIILGQSEEHQLRITAFMSDGTTRDVTKEAKYESNKPEVATVDSNGLIKVLPNTIRGSKASIKVNYKNIQSYCEVKVIDKTVNVTSLTIDSSSIVLGQLGEKQLKVTATMADGTTKDITKDGARYGSNSPNEITVDSNGLIKVLSAAKLDYSYTVEIYYMDMRTTVVVNVKNVSKSAVRGITLNTSNIKLVASEKWLEEKQLKVTATMADGTTKDVTKDGATYTSNDTRVATVDANGLIKMAPTAYNGEQASIIINYQGITSACIVIAVDYKEKVTQITVDPSNVNLWRLQEKQLKVAAALADGTTKDITKDGATYTTSNPKVATVDANGLVKIPETAQNGEQATITITYQGVTATCIVTAVDNTPKLTGITIDPTNVTLEASEQWLEEKQLKVTATMSDGITKDVTKDGATYTTSDPKVATVDANGLIKIAETARTGEQATITVTYQGYTKTCIVNAKNTIRYMTGIIVDPSNVTLTVSEQWLEEKQLKVTATMSDGTTMDVTRYGATYTTSDPRVATVDANGLIKIAETAQTGDQATITVTYQGVTATCVVTANNTIPRMIGIKVVPDKVSLEPSQEKQFEVVAVMSDGTTRPIEQDLGYGISDESVATVDGANKLIKILPTAKPGQKAKMWVSYENYNAECEIEVKAPPVYMVGISLDVNNSSLTLAPGQERKLVVTAKMSDGSTKTLTEGVVFSSDNPNSILVDNNGLVTIPEGTEQGTIGTITAKYNEFSATCKVTVIDNRAILVGMKLNTNYKVMTTEEFKLTATAVMSDGTTVEIPTNELTFEINNTSVATVDTNGVVRLAQGAIPGLRATVTVKYKGISTICVIEAGQ